MNLKQIKRLLVMLALVGAAAWQSNAQNDASRLWIKVSDDFAPADTALLFFVNTPAGTYNIDIVNTIYTELDPPPPPPSGPDFKFTGYRPPAAGQYGGYPLDVHGIPALKDTFQLVVAYIGTDADFSNFAVEWNATYYAARCDSIFLVAKTAGLQDLLGNPIPTKIDMLASSRLDLLQPIQAVGSSSFRFQIYRYGFKLIDSLTTDPFKDPWVTDVKELSSRVPSSFSLHQNYPNPFNPTTTIAFDVQKRSMISIGVFNLLGQQISSLVSEEVNPGTFSTVWNGTTGQGLSAGSGVYFVRMTARTLDGSAEVYSSLRKIVLMK